MSLDYRLQQQFQRSGYMQYIASNFVRVGILAPSTMILNGVEIRHIRLLCEHWIDSLTLHTKVGRTIQCDHVADIIKTPEGHALNNGALSKVSIKRAGIRLRKWRERI